ncbi:MAG: ATP-binding protein [Alphaproteobacteria bacterium]|nr:ATP-binding protein [Alphaproteobacteria bacterium]
MSTSPGITPADQPPVPPLQRSVERVLEWFLSEPIRRDLEATRQARLVVASALALMAVEVLLALMLDWTPALQVGSVYLPRPVVTAVLFAALINLSIALAARVVSKPDTLAYILTVSLAVMFGFLGMVHGGFRAPVTWWLAAVPMFAAFLSGPRSILFAFTLVLLELFGMYVLDTHGVAFPLTLAPPTNAPDNVLRAQIILLGFVSFIGWYYEQSRLSTSRDLVEAYSDLERTNAALRMSQLNVRQIAENIGQGMWMHDLRAHRVVYANPAFDDIFHLSRTRLAADPDIWRARVHPEDTARMPTDPDGKDHVYRLQVNDDVRWVRHSVYPVGDETTPYHRAIHIVADITLARTAEALRERYLETVLEVQENERRHLARELHDETGQSLTALLVGLRALANTLTDEAQQQLAAMLADQLRGVVGDMSRLARGLHPSVLDELGLVAGLQRLADDARETHALDCHVQVTGRELEHSLSPTARLAIYRIVQESLTNVSRHARATAVDIGLTIDAERVQVRIEDDGQGFDPAAPSPRHELSSGLGLMSMQERATLLGGGVRIESAPGAGTTVIGELPTRRRSAMA